MRSLATPGTDTEPAFRHTQRVPGQALAQLRIDAARPVQRLEAWLRGQVYDGAGVVLRATGRDPMIFASYTQDDPP